MKEDVIEVYFDFTCPYSRRTGAWLRALDEPVRWRPFLLRESNRRDEGAPEWERDDALTHPSVLALALHEAVARAGGDADRFRWRLMDLLDTAKVGVDMMREIADAACAGPLTEHDVRAGLADVAASHTEGAALGAFGTPTLAAGGTALYLKLTTLPPAERSRHVRDAVVAVLLDLPEIGELKRASRV